MNPITDAPDGGYRPPEDEVSERKGRVEIRCNTCDLHRRGKCLLFRRKKGMPGMSPACEYHRPKMGIMMPESVEGEYPNKGFDDEAMAVADKSWRAAFCADPGCISCPDCGRYLWRIAKVIMCPCGAKIKSSGERQGNNEL